MASATVRMRETCLGNVFVGTAEELIQAGLIEAHQLPKKTMCSFFPDGTKVRQGSGAASKLEGYKKVERTGEKFRVTIRQSDAEQDRRHSALLAELRAERQRVLEERQARERLLALPRRAHLRLVWSAPQ
jgi:hypothetical protein